MVKWAEEITNLYKKFKTFFNQCLGDFILRFLSVHSISPWLVKAAETIQFFLRDQITQSCFHLLRESQTILLLKWEELAWVRHSSTGEELVVFLPRTLQLLYFCTFLFYLHRTQYNFHRQRILIHARTFFHVRLAQAPEQST